MKAVNNRLWAFVGVEMALMAYAANSVIYYQMEVLQAVLYLVAFNGLLIAGYFALNFETEINSNSEADNQ